MQLPSNHLVTVSLGPPDGRDVGLNLHIADIWVGGHNKVIRILLAWPYVRPKFRLRFQVVRAPIDPLTWCIGALHLDTHNRDVSIRSVPWWLELGWWHSHYRPSTLITKAPPVRVQRECSTKWANQICGARLSTYKGRQISEVRMHRCCCYNFQMCEGALSLDLRLSSGGSWWKAVIQTMEWSFWKETSIFFHWHQRSFARKQLRFATSPLHLSSGKCMVSSLCVTMHSHQHYM